jgi:hypothetical protein
MRTRHAACLVRVCTLLAVVLPMLPGQVAAAPPRQEPSSSVMAYHELTQRPAGSLPIDTPVLSGDGRRAIWAESRWTPTQSNQVFALDIKGGQPREIDAYRPICECQTSVDVSDDGNTVVSTDGLRIRVVSGVATGGAPREVLRLSNNVISALRISGDGKRVAFMVSRDTTISEANFRNRGAPIPRGIWAMAASGRDPIQLAGIEEVAAASGVPVAELEAYPDFRRYTQLDSYALDVSDDGRRIIFGASAGTAGEGIFSITESGLDTQISRLVTVPNLYQVAVSGDGQTVAFPTAGGGVSVMAGGTLKPLPNFDFKYSLRFQERLQLNRDGTKLLGRDQLGLVLVDVATLTKRWLVPLAIPEAHLFTGVEAGYATMNAAGTRVLYMARPNGENLVVIDLGTTNPGGAPLIRGIQVAPDTIPDDGSKSASVSAEISWDGTLIGVRLEILHDGELDFRIGSGLVNLQDTVGPDPRRLEGIFAADVSYSKSSDEEAVPGPRNLRLIIESQAEDGRYHGTVFDADKTLTVGGIGLGSHYQGEVAVDDAQIAARLFPPGDFRELRDLRATIQLDPATNRVVGGSLSYEAFLNDPSPLRRDVFSSATVQGSRTVEVLPAGILGQATFYGELTSYDGNGNASPGYESYQVFFYASNPAGQLVLCGYDVTIWDLEEAELQHQWCLANPFIVLQPVQAAPPVA